MRQRGSFAEPVSSREPAPSKVSMATQVSLGNPVNHSSPLRPGGSYLSLDIPSRLQKQPRHPVMPKARVSPKQGRFGHGSQQCRGKATFAKCAKNDHPTDSCTNDAHCVNFGDPHLAYSRSCRTWKEEKEVLALKVKENLSYPEARRRFGLLRKGSFAQVVQRGPAPLTVAVATQTSFLDYGRPLQSLTLQLKIQLPGRAISAGRSTDPPTQSANLRTPTGQQPLSSQAVSQIQDGPVATATAPPPQSSSREKGRHSRPHSLEEHHQRSGMAPVPLLERLRGRNGWTWVTPRPAPPLPLWLVVGRAWRPVPRTRTNPEEKPRLRKLRPWMSVEKSPLMRLTRTTWMCKLLRNKLCEIIRRHEGGEADLVEDVRKRYIGDYPRRQLTTYRGEPNALLDEEITEYEVADVIRGLKTKSAPGPDGVTNNMLRNLDTEAVAAVTRFLNKCWQDGKIPRQWKAAKVVMIPKPGKRPQLRSAAPHLPHLYKPNCKLCGGHANLRHMVWDCSRIDRKSHPLLEKIDNQESWEALLLCSDPSVQNQLVQLAEDAAKTQKVQAAV
ncbi:hypothetical protein ISCGN_011664 [Ixodes scapularis]